MHEGSKRIEVQSNGKNNNRTGLLSHTYLHTHMHTYIHTYIHIHTPFPVSCWQSPSSLLLLSSFACFPLSFSLFIHTYIHTRLPSYLPPTYLPTYRLPSLLSGGNTSAHAKLFLTYVASMHQVYVRTYVGRAFI